MYTVSSNLASKIEDGSQTVVPKVVARFADNRFLDNLTWSSSSEFYENQILRNDCTLYWRFADFKAGQVFIADYSGSGIVGNLDGSNYGSDTSALNRVSSYYGTVTDSFTRADDVDDLGYVDGGYSIPWEIYGSAVFGISSNKAYTSSGIAGSKAIIDMGDTDGYIEATIGTSDTTILQHGFYIRYVDEDNWVRWNYNYVSAFAVNDSYMVKCVDGASTTIYTDAVSTFVNGDVIKFEALNDTISIYKNGVLNNSTVITDAILMTGTGFGIMSGSPTINTYDAVTISAFTPSDRSFDSKSGANVVYNDSTPDLGIVTDSTVNFWIKNKYANSPAGVYIFNIQDEMYAKITGSTISCYWKDVTAFENILSAGTCYGSSWAMVTMRKTGNVIAVFVNGVKVTEATITNAVTVSGAEIAVGAQNSAMANPFVGLLDEFSVHNVALTDKQIKNIYLSGDNPGQFVGAGTYFTADQAVNGIKEESVAYAICEGLDEFGNPMTFSGEYKVLGTQEASKDTYGWWSRSSSDGTGQFTEQEIAWFEFDVRKANAIEVSTGWITGRIEDYSVFLLEQDGTAHQFDITFATEETVSTTLFGVTYDVIAFGVEMLSTEHAGDIGRIYEANLIYDVDISDDVVALTVDKVRDNYDSTLPIGLTSANTGSIQLSNIDKVYNPYGTSDYAPYIQPDTEFFVSLGWVLDDGSIEYVKLGDSLFADSWNVESSGMTASPSLRDYSKYLQETTPSEGMVFQNVTAGRAITEIVKSQGYPARKIVYYDSYYRQIVHDRPTAFWRMSDITTVVVDEGGRHDGLLSGTYTQGNTSLIAQEADPLVYTYDRVAATADDPSKKMAYCTKFAGGKVSVSDNDNTLKFLDNWTIEATVKVDSATAGNDYIVSRYNGATSYNYELYVRDLGSSTFCFEIKYSDSATTVFTARSKTYTQAEIEATPFHIIAMRKGNQLTIHVNGELNDPLSTATTSALQCAEFTTPVCIANRELGGGNYFSGRLSSISMWNHALSQDQIDAHWIASQLGTVYVFNYLFFKDATPWDAMLEFATADVGMFYFDEDAIFRYEYSNTFHESVFQRHRTPQFNFSDEVNIVDGSHVIDVQANRVIIMVNPMITVNQGYQSIWKADEGESLAVTETTAALDSSALEVFVVDTENPLWLKAGYLKIDDEIMSYDNTELNRLFGVKRGLFGTKAVPHVSSSLAREVRVYDIKYTESPAVAIKRPFVTAKEFEQKVDVDKFVTTPFGATVILSANSNTAEDELVLLQGNNPVNELNYAYSIAGIPIEVKTTKEQVQKEVRELNTKIRKFHPKEIIIDNQFIQDKAWAEKLAEFIIRFFAAPVQIVNLEISGVPQLQLGDLIRVTKFDKMDMTNKDYWIIESSTNYDGGVQQSLTLRAYSGGVDA